MWLVCWVIAIIMFIMLKNSCTHLLFYCVSCLILSYFVLSIFIKLWEVPGRSHVDLDFSRSTCDLFAQHANAQSHKFNMAKLRTTTTWAHAGVTKRYGDRWKAMTMGNGPNDNRHVVWALGACFRPFLNILPQFWPVFLTFRALFTRLDAFSNTVNHLRPLQRVFQSFPTFLCPHIIPQLPQPFPNPCSHFQPLSLISTCFRPISTDLGSHDEPTHLYDLPWPFSSPTVHFWSHTLIPDPKPHFQPFLHFPNRYHVFLRVYEFGQPPTSTWTRSKVSTHVFETVRAFSTHFRLFLTFF